MDTSKAAIQMQRLEGESLLVHLTGRWNIDQDVPSAEIVDQQLHADSGIQCIEFSTKNLGDWDSSVLIFLTALMRLSSTAGIQVKPEGLPAGVRQLIALAGAVPKKEGTGKGTSRESFLATVGSNSIAFVDSAKALLEFVGAACVAFSRLLVGRAQFRFSDLGIFLQGTGAQAVPIVSLITFLVGLILAFVGILQLKLFGAQIYVADLVGIAMVREMGAIMTGIIMAGRTGAAFAAQLGTMQVNEEIDALKTLAVSPMEFLVLPRMLALTVMMPLLTLYGDLMGILGGAVVAVGIYDIELITYLDRTMMAVGLNDLFIGLFMGVVFGILVALSGCLRGMQCGRSASEVGDAATSAVVTGIVCIIVATALITVVCDVIGI